MFVFGEVQDPNQETVNLVEDIVRSQIIELVRLQLQTSIRWLRSLTNLHRSYKRERLRHVEAQDTYQPRT